jgi:hypothetical protein
VATWAGGGGGPTSAAGGGNLLGRDKGGDGDELRWRLLPSRTNDDYDDGPGGGGRLTTWARGSLLQSVVAILEMNVSLYIVNHHSCLHFCHARRLIQLCPSLHPPCHRRPPLLRRQNCWGYSEEMRDFTSHSTEREVLPPSWVFSYLPLHACTSPIHAALCR